MRAEDLLIRAADAGRDASACAAIYAPYVEGPVSFEETPPGEEQMRARIVDARAWLVAERRGGVQGFAYAGEHRSRPGYRWAVDTSVYVAPDAHGQGTGRALYEALLSELEARHYRMACAGITLPNPPSVALHERLGFLPVGIYRRIGYKAGAWRDVGWWQRPLGADREVPGGSPPEPR